MASVIFITVTLFLLADSPDEPSGLMCLFIALTALDEEIGSLDELTRELNAQQDASDYLAKMEAVAKSRGLHAKRVATNPDDLYFRPEPFVCIVPLRSDRFVLLTDVSLREDTITVLTPPKQMSSPSESLMLSEVNVSREALDTQWNGDALLLSRDELSEEGTHRPQNRLWLLMAAGLTIACIAALLTWRMAKRRNDIH